MARVESDMALEVAEYIRDEEEKRIFKIFNAG